MKCDYPGCEKELSKEEVAAYFEKIKSKYYTNRVLCPEHEKYATLIHIPSKYPFHPSQQRADKSQLVKILECSSDLCRSGKNYLKAKGTREEMLDDFADVVQTLVNFMDAFDVVPAEIEAAYNRIDKKNVEYGRFKHNEATYNRIDNNVEYGHLKHN